MQGKHPKKMLDEELERVVTVMKDLDPSEDRYGVMVANLIKLSQARTETFKREIDVNVVIGAVTNIVSILVILNYDQLHVVSSKAIGLLVKPRI